MSVNGGVLVATVSKCGEAITITPVEWPDGWTQSTVLQAIAAEIRNGARGIAGMVWSWTRAVRRGEATIEVPAHEAFIRPVLSVGKKPRIPARGRHEVARG